MLKAETISMLKKNQTTLAAWTAMFVMTSEFMAPEKMAISVQERRFLKKRQRPPHQWRIWIGKRDTDPLNVRWIHDVFTFLKDKSEAAPPGTIPAGNTQASTILLGQQLVIHAMSSSVARSIIKRWRHPESIERKIQQIWPVTNREVTWPNIGAPLSSDEVRQLAKHFWNELDTGAKIRNGFL
jgi:hypothetical protein